MAEILVATDDFSGAAKLDRLYTSSGARWVTSTGRLGVDGLGAAFATSFPMAWSSTYLASPGLDAGGSDHAIEVRALSASLGVYVRGVVGNIVTDSYFLIGVPGGTIHLYRGTGSTAANQALVTAAVGTFVPGDIIKVAVEGTTLRLWVDGQLQSTHTINASAGTWVGLFHRSDYSAPFTALYDDLKVTRFGVAQVALEGTVPPPRPEEGGPVLPLDSDRKGMFWLLGDEGAVNPAVSGAVVLSASGIYSGSYPLSLLTDRNSDATAGFITTNVSNSWFKADLGAANAVAPAWMSIRQRNANGNQMASLAFEGSNDNSTWTLISAFDPDPALGAWTDLTDLSPPEPYRYFRIRHVGTNVSGNWYLICAVVIPDGKLSVQGGALAGVAPGTCSAAATLSLAAPIAGQSAAGTGSALSPALLTGAQAPVTGADAAITVGAPAVIKGLGQALALDPDGTFQQTTRVTILEPGDGRHEQSRGAKVHATYDGSPANV